MAKTLRDKYIELVEEQAELERISSEQIASMRRALIRVSLIADGVDNQLDLALDQFRDNVRANKTTSFVHELSDLEHAILAFDERKNERHHKVVNSINDLSEGLKTIATTRDAKSKLKTFSKKLPVKLQKQYAFVNALEELHELQQLVLSNTSAEPTSLFQKLFGKTTNDELPEDDPQRFALDNSDTDTDIDTEIETSTKNISGSADKEVDSEDKNSSAKNTLENKIEYIEREDSISKTDLPIDFKTIADRATAILQSLLDDVKPEKSVEEKILNARERIKNGLSWNDFVPTLEDIRDLILQSNAEANREFSVFLLQLDEELKTVSQLAKTATFTAQQQDAWQEHVENEVGNQLQVLKKEVNDADDIDDLKQAVNSRIQEIRSAIKPQDKQNQDASKTLANQVQALMSHVKKLEKESEKTSHILMEEHARARKDALTGLPNREAYNEKSFDEYNRWRRYKTPMSLAVIDIDHFKQINDSYGHQVGDKVLKLLAKEIVKHLRDSDFVARFGGEEFVVLLPESAKQDAYHALEKVREHLAEIPFHFNNKPVQITVSIGICEFGEGDTIDSVFQKADKYLYQAKHAGRNRCVIEE